METIALSATEFTKNLKKLISRFDDHEVSIRFLNLLKVADLFYLWQVVILNDITQIPKIDLYGNMSKKELNQLLKELQLDFGMKFTEAQLATLKELTTEKKVSYDHRVVGHLNLVLQG